VIVGAVPLPLDGFTKERGGGGDTNNLGLPVISVGNLGTSSFRLRADAGTAHCWRLFGGLGGPTRNLPAASGADPVSTAKLVTWLR
jgi:hypothetical protein